jgi:uncharacterized iron-regulated membrane protein
VNRLRRTVRRLHLWLGLGLGVLMVLAGLTGSALVFYVEIDGWMHPEQAAEGMAGPRSYDHAILTLRKTFPGKQGPWRFEVTGKTGAIPARYYNPPETAGRHFAPMLVWLSPDGKRMLRRDFWGDNAMTWIYDLHYQLLLGKAGGTVFGYAGIALLVLLASGLWAWWPRGSWGRALRFKSGAARTRRLRDIHKLAGLAGMPLLIVLTTTGVMLALPDETAVVLKPLLGAPAPIPSLQSDASAGRQIAPSAAIAAASAQWPDARLAWIEVPGFGPGAFRLRMQRPGDPSRRFPHSYVWIDQYSGRIAGKFDAVAQSPSTTVGNWLHPLHDGSAGGLVLRVLTTVFGMVPVVLFVTGYMRWRARSRRAGPSRVARDTSAGPSARPIAP